MLIPYKVDVPMRRWPIANLVILATIAGVFVLEVTDPARGFDPYILEGFSLCGIFGHMWLHADLFHLLGNMIFLWTFGNAVCAKIGNFSYAAIYVAMGAFAALVHLLFDGGTAVGASGAINGVIGVYLVLYPLNAIECIFVLWFFAKPFSVSGYWLILLWLAFDVYGLVTGGAGVAYWAHIAGFAGGFALAAAMVARGLLRMEPYERSLFQVLRGKWSRSDTARLPTRPDRPPASSPSPPRKSPHRTAPPPGSVIIFACTCGQRLKLPDRFVGETVKCPVCGQTIRAPKG